MRLAIAARIWESGRSSYSTPGTIGAVTGAAATVTGAVATVTVAASTSRRMMRPPGPVPRISRRSTPVCAAIFFARGDALTRPVATAVGGAAWAGAGMPTAPALTAAGRETDGTVAGAAGAGADGAGAGAAGGAERVSFRAEAPPAAPAPAPAGMGEDTSNAAMSLTGSALTPII